jgi:hypothetical protein
MKILVASGYLAGVAAALLALVAIRSTASAQGTTGLNVVILLRLTGDNPAIPQIRSCLVAKLSQMPDIELTPSQTNGVRFIIDVVAAKNASERIFASLVVAETFPVEQFRPRVKEGEDGDALLTSIRYYTLLRLHEVIPDRSYQSLCARIVAEFGNKVLAREYTERND